MDIKRRRSKTFWNDQRYQSENMIENVFSVVYMETGKTHVLVNTDSKKGFCTADYIAYKMLAILHIDENRLKWQQYNLSAKQYPGTPAPHRLKWVMFFSRTHSAFWQCFFAYVSGLNFLKTEVNKW